ncbi:MAG: peptide chain release factor N(5)-glutamine methyltransferase [Candidatus Omnitrophica bacterium]|nr:peptide chain release factor N(5)-glutamine methyltransferase [Candidatus Omnitrophota bacterium]MCF7878700.1 peptide chain release factor N(5)-glutamine methyltransferase [Candidatus Omnitrophota bacterium]MCF7892963.1 peptide chain release factor N(5)-glutamine methyltransferase [Candidatus Omnitrophota bacterium]
MKIKDWYRENKRYFSLSELNFIFKSFAQGKNCLLDKNEVEKLDKIKADKFKGVPLALSLGREEFFGFTFKVNKNTLIPRPETELLTEAAQELISKNSLKKILDLCCGCGNIGISLDKLITADLKIYLADLSSESLALAGENAVNLGSKVKIVNSDLFSGFKEDSFDLIISNPPYVESKNIKGSLAYEPKLALDGGKDGLNLIEKIIVQAYRYLEDRGFLMMEFGYGQKKRVENIIYKNGQYIIKTWIKDYSNIWRGVILQKNNA